MIQIKGLCQAAIKKWGADHQVLKTVEELGELIGAATKHLLTNDYEKQMASEIADVEMMLCQLRMILRLENVNTSYLENASYLRSTLNKAKVKESLMFLGSLVNRILDYFEFPNDNDKLTLISNLNILELHLIQLSSYIDPEVMLVIRAEKVRKFSNYINPNKY